MWIDRLLLLFWRHAKREKENDDASPCMDAADASGYLLEIMSHSAWVAAIQRCS